MTRFTPVEQEIADCVLKGWGYCRIAQYRHISRFTARNIVHEIAAKLPPYGDLRGYSKVLYWLSIRSVDPEISGTIVPTAGDVNRQY